MKSVCVFTEIANRFCKWLKIKALESDFHSHTNAVARRRGQTVVIEPSHVFHMEELEDVVNTKSYLAIGAMAVHYIGIAGELHQQRVVGVLRQQRVVLVAKGAPKHLHTDEFAPFQLF